MYGLKQYELKEYENGNGKIYIGIPRERIYIPAFVDNRDAILYEMQSKGVDAGYYQSEGHRVDRNRDTITENFMDLPKKPEWLVMLDSDMEHPRIAPERLTSYGKPIVGSLYFHRGHIHDPFVFKRLPSHLVEPDKWGRYRKQWIPMRDEVYNFLIDHQVPMRDGSFIVENLRYDPVIECDAVATGCMAIHRSVFETMEPPWWEYQIYANSEDLTFCDDAKFKHGIPIHADLSTICGHFNWVAMGQAQFRTLYEGRGINLTTFTKRDAAKWLEEFWGIDFDRAIKRIEDGSAHVVGDYFKKRFRKKTIDQLSSSEVDEFYRSEEIGKLYVIELLHWNFGSTFNQLRRILMPIRNSNVLEIGSGIGTIAMQLVVQYNEVVASEVNETLHEFTKLRWKQLEKELVIPHGSLYLVDQEWRTMSEDEQFGVVVAFDVFEHIPEDELKALVKDIHRVLPVGGRIVYHANFGQQDLYPMHYDHSEWWIPYLEEVGFMQIGTLEALKVR